MATSYRGTDRKLQVEGQPAGSSNENSKLLRGNGLDDFPARLPEESKPEAWKKVPVVPPRAYARLKTYQGFSDDLRGELREVSGGTIAGEQQQVTI
jgi:hypothetical protein